MRQDVFIETENFGRLRAAIALLHDTRNGTPGLGMVRGKAGRGKTLAARRMDAQMSDTHYLAVWENWTQCAFLRALCFEVTGMRPGTSEKSKLAIVEALGTQPATIIIDEADRLHPGRLEDLRDISEYSGCSVALIGEEALYAMLHAKTRIWSRITQCVEFGAVGREDIMLFGKEAAGLTISPEAGQEIERRTGGDFRLVRNDIQGLEQMSKAAGSRDVDATMVRKLPGWRK